MFKLWNLNLNIEAFAWITKQTVNTEYKMQYKYWVEHIDSIGQSRINRKPGMKIRKQKSNVSLKATIRWNLLDGLSTIKWNSSLILTFLIICLTVWFELNFCKCWPISKEVREEKEEEGEVRSLITRMIHIRVWDSNEQWAIFRIIIFDVIFNPYL